MQYPHHPKRCDQGLRETPECVNPAEYVKYRMIRAAAVGFRVPTPHHGSPRTSARSGVLPFLGVVESRAFTVLCHTGGRYSGYGSCRSFPPTRASSGPDPDHPVCHVPSVAGAVEAFFAGRDLAAATCRTYRQASAPSSETVGADRPVTDLHPDQVAAVFAELWADRAPATWNTRRVAVQASERYPARVRLGC